jgi:hypothetical protein
MHITMEYINDNAIYKTILIYYESLTHRIILVNTNLSHNIRSNQTSLINCWETFQNQHNVNGKKKFEVTLIRGKIINSIRPSGTYVTVHALKLLMLIGKNSCHCIISFLFNGIPEKTNNIKK